jgi:hypothetical protein
MDRQVIFGAVVFTCVMAASLVFARDWLLAQAQAWIKTVRVAEIRRATRLSHRFHEDIQTLVRDLGARRKLTTAQVQALLTSTDPDQTLRQLRAWTGDETLGEALPHFLRQLEERQRAEERITRLGKLYLTIKAMRRNL